MKIRFIPHWKYSWSFGHFAHPHYRWYEFDFGPYLIVIIFDSKIDVCREDCNKNR